ncbi:Early nodulin-like protein 2, partial [Mucuna pruriens]
MEFQRLLCLFLFLLTLLSSSQAYKFNVGGSQGWVPNPSESYNNWAGRNRFQINDIIVFKYKKGSDSVLEVKKEDYDKCNKTNPIKKFENGDTEFKFDRSGPFYFISGKDGNCEKGQKLIIVVLSPRTPPKPSPSPSPKPNPPTVSPPASPPTSPSPASPSTSPSPVPTAPSPVAIPPPPANSPPAPGPDTHTTPPAQGPSSPPPAPGKSPSPSSNSTAPPSGNSGSFVAPSMVLVYSVTIVVGAALL